MTNAAILFEPDGYVLSGPKLMGRQAAGNAFLRAAVAGLHGQPLFAYTPQRRSAEVFGQLVQQIDPQAQPHWLPADRLDLLTQVGTLYLPGPDLAAAARLRLRAGPGAYSLVGVTHTTASHGAMDSLVALPSAPVMPWDALICTSSAVAGTVKVVLEAELEHLRWRLGTPSRLTLPQFPIIPLGVHAGDFVISSDRRQAARQTLGIAEDEVVALFVGRLSFHAKAHPHAMYAGLQAAAERTGRKLVLVQCGWFAHEEIKRSFVEGAAQLCPAVRALFTDGREAAQRDLSWSAADLFLSLSDNVQETFGLTPLEAMAAGLPVIVSDWDGYKDTVRDGVDGFRIPTWMPPPHLGEPLARAHEAGVDNYDFYCGLTCQTVSLDLAVLADRLSEVVGNAELRRSLGAAGQARVAELYDWSVVFRRYQSLWAQLAELRQMAQGGNAQGNAEWQALVQAAPRVAPGRLDPFRSFGHYPTRLIAPHTRIAARPGASRTAYEHLAQHGLFSYAGKVLPAADHVERLLAVLADGPLSARLLAERSGLDLGEAVMAVAVLAKMGLLDLIAEGEV